MSEPYIKLARQAVEFYIKYNEIIDPREVKLPAEILTRRAGIFVSIYKKINDQDLTLRGCIGTFLPTQKNIALEIIKNAIAAATQDNRFSPVTKEEIPFLTYSVDLLSPPEPVKDIKELDPKKYGIIVKTDDGRTGLLLPDLAGVERVEQQIAIAASKAGIDPTKEAVEIFRFTVERHKE